MKKYNIFVGNYGSGKTELSLNTALDALAQGKRTVLVDMDIVNPYFRSSEHTELLQSRGARVIAPCFANTAVDVPSLPPDIFAPFDTVCDFAVFDAGGDPVGASALGILSEKFNEHADELEVYYVINARRPLSETPERIIEMLHLIEGKSARRVTALVNNTNIALETTADILVQGQAVVEEVSQKLGIPIVFAAALPEIAAEVRTLLPNTEIYETKLYMRPEWLDAKY